MSPKFLFFKVFILLFKTYIHTCKKPIFSDSEVRNEKKKYFDGFFYSFSRSRIDGKRISINQEFEYLIKIVQIKVFVLFFYLGYLVTLSLYIKY